jgi:hypothetical protein
VRPENVIIKTTSFLSLSANYVSMMKHASTYRLDEAKVTVKSISRGQLGGHDPQTVARSHHLSANLPTLANTTYHELPMFSAASCDDCDSRRKAVP